MRIFTDPLKRNGNHICGFAGVRFGNFNEFKLIRNLPRRGYFRLMLSDIRPNNGTKVFVNTFSGVISKAKKDVVMDIGWRHFVFDKKIKSGYYWLSVCSVKFGNQKSFIVPVKKVSTYYIHVAAKNRKGAVDYVSRIGAKQLIPKVETSATYDICNSVQER